MDKEKLFDAALQRMMGELDDMEGKGAMAHDADDCPDPLGCNMHDDESGDALSGEAKQEPGSPAAVTVQVHKGIPSLDGKKADEALSDDEKDKLRELLK